MLSSRRPPAQVQSLEAEVMTEFQPISSVGNIAPFKLEFRAPRPQELKNSFQLRFRTLSVPSIVHRARRERVYVLWVWVTNATRYHHCRRITTDSTLHEFLAASPKSQTLWHGGTAAK